MKSDVAGKIWSSDQDSVFFFTLVMTGVARATTVLNNFFFKKKKLKKTHFEKGNYLM